MGMILCENHGRTGIRTGILEQICQKVLDDIPITQEELSYILVDYYDNETFMFTNKYILTKKFKKNPSSMITIKYLPRKRTHCFIISWDLILVPFVGNVSMNI
jgi:hypothetical protein